MKPCPYCAELIQDQASKCRYCGEWLDPSKRPSWSAEGTAAAVASTALPSSVSAASLLLDDDDDDDLDDMHEGTSATLPVGSGLPELSRRESEEPRTWSAPAWLANAQAARGDAREAELPPTDRSTLEEVALRMERIRQSAAAVRDEAEAPPRALRPTVDPLRATLEEEPGVTLPAGSRRAVGLGEPQRPARSSRQAPAVRDEDDFGDFDDEPLPRRTPQARSHELSSERPTVPDISREALMGEVPVDTGRRRKLPARPAAVVAEAPAPRPRRAEPDPILALDDEDDFDDELPMPHASGFDDGFLDDEDDEGEGDDDFDDFGPAAASRPLPWRPILIAASVIVVAGVLVFRDYLFPGAAETDVAAETDAADGGTDTDPEADTPAPETKVAADAKAQGEGQPVQPDANPETNPQAGADGGAAATPAAPAALDAEMQAKLDEARKGYADANGNGRKLQPVSTSLQEVLAKAPDHPEALALMAQVYLDLNKMDDSLATANRCTEVAPSTPGCWLAIGVIQETKGANPVAKLAYQKFLDLAPESHYAKDARKALERLK